jgi:photosystem II stability/assembly factor-like uncharacterized protein
VPFAPFHFVVGYRNDKEETMDRTELRTGVHAALLILALAAPAAAQTSWVEITPDGLNTTPQLIGFDPSNDDRVFVGTLGQGLFITSDRGSSWVNVYNDFYIPGIASTVVRDVVLNPAQPLQGVAITLSGAYSTEDGGASWTRHPDNDTGDAPMLGFALTHDPAGSGAVAAEVGTPGVGGTLWRYSWSTRGWENLIPAFEGLGGQSCYALGFDASAPRKLFVGHSAIKVFWTSNFGATHKKCGAGLPAGLTRAVVPDPTIANRVHATVGNVLYRTTGGTCTWSAVATFPAEITALIHNPAVPDFMYLGTDGSGVYESLDRGNTWTPMTQAGLTLLHVVDVGMHPLTHRWLYVTATDPSRTLGGVFSRDATPTSPPPPPLPNLQGARTDLETRRLVASPNPFSASTTLAFRLSTATDVRLSVYDAAGRRVRLLAAGRWAAGVHRVTWDGTDDRGARVANGIYFASGETGHGEMKPEHVVLLR